MSTPNIQWFPGHMHKARKEIAQRLAQIDLVIEVLDARLPFSSENPLLAELRGDKPCVKILNKSDLADPHITSLWLDYFSSNQDIQVLALRATDSDAATQVIAAAKNLLPHQASTVQGIQTLIAGIPNVGKSTLINSLAGRVIAKTGNEPAITKQQQRINLQQGIVLFDTPGVLWPNVENRNSGFRLATSGAIRDTAIDYEDVALFAIDYLLQAYPQALATRYQEALLLDDSVKTLDAIGRANGCLGRGGVVDFQRAAKRLVNDFRSGALGKLSLETPAIMHSEFIELEQLRTAKETQKEKKRKEKKTRRGQHKK